MWSLSLIILINCISGSRKPTAFHLSSTCNWKALKLMELTVSVVISPKEKMKKLKVLLSPQVLNNKLSLNISSVYSGPPAKSHLVTFSSFGRNLPESELPSSLSHYSFNLS